MFEKRPIILSVAGFDPSGGAGIITDCKTFERLHCYGMAVPTANTLQTESVFVWIQWQNINLVLESVTVLLESYPISTIKIGIIPELGYVLKLVNRIKAINPKIQIIWDPVLKTTTDFSFITELSNVLLTEILDQIDLITPNFNEIELLVDTNCTPLEKAQYLSRYTAVLLKGGHNLQAPGVDYLIEKELVRTLQPTKKVSYTKHGSGCVLSSAIAAYMSKDFPIYKACLYAKKYTADFLDSNPTLLGYHDC